MDFVRKYELRKSCHCKQFWKNRYPFLTSRNRNSIDSGILVVGQISLFFVHQKVLPACAKSVFSNEGGFWPNLKKCLQDQQLKIWTSYKVLLLIIKKSKVTQDHFQHSLIIFICSFTHLHLPSQQATQTTLYYFDIQWSSSNSFLPFMIPIVCLTLHYEITRVSGLSNNASDTGRKRQILFDRAHLFIQVWSYQMKL